MNRDINKDIEDLINHFIKEMVKEEVKKIGKSKIEMLSEIERMVFEKIKEEEEKTIVDELKIIYDKFHKLRTTNKRVFEEVRNKLKEVNINGNK